MKKVVVYFLVLLLTACSTRGCVESQFHLAKESDLPGWFQIPEGLKRSDLDVTLAYYTNGTADINLYDIRKGKRKLLNKKLGRNWHHPDYWAWAQEDWPKRSHPSYVVIISDRVKEIIEHKKMEPIFYISSESDMRNTMKNNTYNKSLQPTAKRGG